MPADQQTTLMNSEVTEILSSPPRWIVRWGITLILLLMLLIFLLSFFIKWPETVMVPGMQKTGKPPVFYAVFNAGTAARIKPGMKAVIEMADYNSDRFGVLHGYVSGLPERKNGAFVCPVQLSNGLYTSAGKLLTIVETMQAQIIITIAEKPLIKKLIARGF
jgi:hypothetical protein